MPTVLVEDGYRFMIFTDDHEPAHVHAFKGGGAAKISLEPAVDLISQNRRLKASELRRVVQIADANRDMLIEKWQELHG